VELYLVEHGFRIVARNLRQGALELDLVARREDLVVVVEVRYRGPASWTSAFGSVLPRKRELLRRAAWRLWRSRYAHDPTVNRLRIDVAAVCFGATGARVEYCPGAFT
jgi:putative endonuclease